MFKRRPGVSREAKIFLFLAVFIFVVLRMLIVLDRNIRPTVWAAARVQAHSYATYAIQEAILENIANKTHYEDLIQLSKDNEGRIVLAQINNMKVNTMIAETTLYVQEAIISLNKEKISIPLGQVFGSYLLSNLGPKIPVTLSPAGIIHTRLIDTFDEAGINQVRHKIFLEIQTDMQVIIPLISDVTKVITTVPIVDAIYPGKVPDTVINLEFPNISVPSPSQ